MSLAEDLNPRAVPGNNKPPPLAEILADRYVVLLDEVAPLGDRAESLPKKIENDGALGRLGDVVKDAGSLMKRLDAARSGEVEPHLTAQREINGFFKSVLEGLDAIKKRLEGIATDYQRAKAAEERRVHEEHARKLREEEERQRKIAEAAAAKNLAGKSMKHTDRAEEAAESAHRSEAASRAKNVDLTRTRSSTGTLSTMRGSWTFEILDIEKIPLEKIRPYLPRADIEKALRAAVKMGAREIAGVRIFHDDKAIFR